MIPQTFSLGPWTFWGGICCLLIRRGPQLMDLSSALDLKAFDAFVALGFYWETLHGITWNHLELYVIIWNCMKCDVASWIMFESHVDLLVTCHVIDGRWDFSQVLLTTGDLDISELLSLATSAAQIAMSEMPIWPDLHYDSSWVLYILYNSL